MAYKPKYAAKSTSSLRRERSAPRDAGRRESNAGGVGIAPPRKQNKGIRLVSILLGIVVIPASLLLTAMLLSFVYTHVGRPKQTAPRVDSEFTVAGPFLQDAAQREDSAAQALAATAAPQATEPPTEPPVVHLHYEIPADAAVAPKPDQSKFGQSNDPKVLQGVLDGAAWLLDGQQTYFDPNGERFAEDDQVRWFQDESMLALSWKEVHDGSVYTYAEVKIQDASQFRRHLAGGEYGSNALFKTTEMAETVNAVVASGGDYYRNRTNFGAVVYEGKVRRLDGTYAETCYIDRNGDMHFTYGGDVLTTQAAQSFVDEHEIQFSLAFGPILVDNGQPTTFTWYGVGEINEEYARAALCQMGPLHYIVMTANTEGSYQQVPTVAAFQKHVIATGAVNAYCIDGGQTASIVMNNQLVNRPVKGEQRLISDIIYFATAVPEGE